VVEARLLVSRRAVDTAEKIAREFHREYEKQAPRHGYETREASRKPWSAVPERNRELMVAVVRELMGRGIIYPGPWLEKH
jgi:hypothetical protein